MDNKEKAQIIDILNDMRDHGVGSTLYYAQRIALVIGEPPVLTPEVLMSDRLQRFS